MTETAVPSTNTTAEVEPVVETKPAPEKHTHLYWIRKHIADFAKRHWIKFTVLLVLLLFGLFIGRGYYHAYVITARQYFGGVVTGIALLTTYIWWFRKRAKLRKRVISLIAIALVVWPVCHYGKPVHDYGALLLRYYSLDVKKIDNWPLTDHERVQPLNSVRTVASNNTDGNEVPTEPHFVRIGDDQFDFTMALEPSENMKLGRYFGGINQIFDVNGTKSDLEYGDAGVKVSFEVGENLKWGRNVNTAVCRALGPWNYLNCEADGVIYMKDDDGKWVQVVPLIHWRNWLFPWPEFGGVVVIEQIPNGILQSIRRTLIGSGHFIPPSKIKDHPFLKGQNILSYRVSRFIAQSFQFHQIDESFFKGIAAPLPWVHKGDTRIPDMPQDCNDLPFTTFARMSEYGGQDSLYHFFPLEPFNTKSRGLCISLFIPADGERAVYANINMEEKDRLIGVTSVASIVTNTFKFFDSSHIPIENRPFCHLIDGQKERMFITTIVTKIEKDGKESISGNNPDVTLTRIKTQQCYYMKPPEPSTWDKQLSYQFALPKGSPLLTMPNGSSGPPIVVNSQAEVDKIVEAAGTTPPSTPTATPTATPPAPPTETVPAK